MFQPAKHPLLPGRSENSHTGPYDENVEHEVLHRLQQLDYTVEHVEFHPELGKGTEDRPIAEFSRQNEWVIVTCDPDFVVEDDRFGYYGAVYFQDATLSAKEVADIIDAMVAMYKGNPVTPQCGSQKLICVTHLS